MPKDITGYADGQMLNKMGIELSFVVRTKFGTFSTKETPGAKGIISNMGACSCEKRADNAGSTGNVDLTLIDYDGEIKLALDVIHVEGSRAIIYQVFEGGNGDDWIPLLFGRITGPLQWNEGTREVSFGVEAEAWSEPVGFAPTKDDFADLNEDVVGTPWPVVFGTVRHIPAVRVRKYASGTLHTDIRLYHPKGYDLNKTTNTLSTKIDLQVKASLDTGEATNKILVKGGKNFLQDTPLNIIIDGVVFRGKFNEEIFTVTGANYPKYTDIKVAARDQSSVDVFNTAVLWVEKDKNGVYPNLVGHHCYFRTTENVTWYNFCTGQSNGKCTFRNKFICPNPTDTQVIQAGDPAKAKGWELLMGPGKIITSAYQISRNGLRIDTEKLLYQLRDTIAARAHKLNQSSFGVVIKAIDRARESANGFWSAYADTEVRLWGEPDPDIYVFSSIPCTEILGVYGKKNVKFMDGKSKKITTVIPKDYYKEQLISNYVLPATGDSASALLFYTPLANYKTPDGAEEWDETVYVSAVSSVGPNVVDIIQYILEKFTDLNIRKSGFDKARELVTDPANFAIFDRRDALQLCQEIAWQARCGLTTESGQADIIFLAKKPDGIFTFDVTNVRYRSMTQSWTDITDVKTMLLGTWTPSYEDTREPDKYNNSQTVALRRTVRAINADDDHRTRTATKVYIYKENVDIYGEHTEDKNIFIYDNEEAVEKCLEFWGHRTANSWKVVHLEGFHDSIGVSLFDGVNIDLPGIPLIRGVVEVAALNPKDKTVSYRIWTPIIAGSSEDVRAWNG